MRDLYSLIDAGLLIPAATYAADSTPVNVDLADYGSAVVALHLGVGGITFNGSNKIEFKLTHGDDTGDMVAVTIDDVLGLESVGAGGIIKSLTAAHAAADVTHVGYRGGKRYVALIADFSGTHGTGTPIAASVIVGDARIST